MRQAITGWNEVVRFFEIGQPIIARDYRGQDKWVEGEIIARLGPLTYEIKTKAGSYWKRHVDQLKETGKKTVPNEPLFSSTGTRTN